MHVGGPYRDSLGEEGVVGVRDGRRLHPSVRKLHFGCVVRVVHGYHDVPVAGQLLYLGGSEASVRAESRRIHQDRIAPGQHRSADMSMCPGQAYGAGWQPLAGLKMRYRTGGQPRCGRRARRPGGRVPQLDHDFPSPLIGYERIGTQVVDQVQADRTNPVRSGWFGQGELNRCLRLGRLRPGQRTERDRDGSHCHQPGQSTCDDRARSTLWPLWLRHFRVLSLG